MEAKKSRNGLFSRIHSREDALKTIRDCAIGFFTVAVLQALVGLFIFPGLLMDAALLAILAGIMLKWHSRVAAVLLLILAGLTAYTTLLNRLGITDEGGRNIFLAIILLWAGIRSVEATFKLKNPNF